MPFLIYLLSLALPVFIAFSGSVFGETLVIQLPSNRTVIVERAVRNFGKKWIVFLPGSSCNLYNLQKSLWLNTLSRVYSVNILVINKAGITASDQCLQPQFAEGSLRPNRIADALSAFKTMIPANAEVLLLGESEGGYVAPDVALQRPEVRGLVLISAGTRSWIDEEIMAVPPSRREKLRQFFQSRVVDSVDLTQDYRGWPYAQLASYDTDATLEALRKLNIPIAAFHGEKDQAIWVEAAIQDFAQLMDHEGKENIESHVIPNAGHGLHGGVTGDMCEKLLSFSRDIIK